MCKYYCITLLEWTSVSSWRDVYYLSANYLFFFFTEWPFVFCRVWPTSLSWFFSFLNGISLYIHSCSFKCFYLLLFWSSLYPSCFSVLINFKIWSLPFFVCDPSVSTSNLEPLKGMAGTLFVQLSFAQNWIGMVKK